jgi:uncharacterized repeat protein (TIGR01451 family)
VPGTRSSGVNSERASEEDSMSLRRTWVTLAGLPLLWAVTVIPVHAQTVTFRPYIQPGDNGPFGEKDQMVVAWQTDEASPSPAAFTVEYGRSVDDLHAATVSARVVDNYLSVDPQFANLVLPFRYGAHSDYSAVLTDLRYDTTYIYRVKGPGLPASGFVSSFHTRTMSDHFVFQVQGDEGYYPNIPGTSPPLTAIYEARIINTMFNVAAVSFPGQPAFRRADLALNTGDNVYVTGADSNYRDVWMHDWNAEVASNDHGAPFIRSLPLYIVAGNHDVGSTGATVNLLADSGATVPGSFGPGPFGGGTGGGDALAYFNNYYFPLNGPTGVDVQYHFTGDTSTATNFLFSFNGVNFNSPAAAEALRASTDVDSGHGVHRQIDHMSNYSFDYGNAHFVFLDANPHVFDNLLPGGPPSTAPAFPFTHYPSVLREWLVNDLDASAQTWKVVVFHQPIFSSGNATISNDQMRTIAAFLQDHGVNMVFNGHEHNYQRSLPIRALPNVTSAPVPNVQQVQIDQAFDGVQNTVPDGVMYFVEGAGGNRDFDDNLANPRGGGTSIDQDDAATGTTALNVNGASHNFVQGPGSWLDTSMTDDAMNLFLAGAGAGSKVTARFKSKVFSFAHVTVDGNVLTLYQISEPLGGSSSATAANPAPFGRDYRGRPLNDPLPDTVFDPVSRMVVSPAGEGTPALLDKVTVTKPDIAEDASVDLSAPKSAAPGDAIEYTFTFRNDSRYALNGAQAVLTLADGVAFDSTSAGTATVQGRDVVVSLGRLDAKSTVTLHIRAHILLTAPNHLEAVGELRSGTAMPVTSKKAHTNVHGR